MTGGFSADGRSAELYDPATGKWVATQSMAEVRGGDGQTATKLADGRVLVTGLSANAELFDPRGGHGRRQGRSRTRWEARRRRR